MKNIQFTAANGFPAKTYEHIFAQIDYDKLNYINVVGKTIPSNTARLWFSIANEIIESIEGNFSEPVIGMGHSLGATTTFIAACKRPELFSRLILTEPIVFKSHYSLALKTLHKLNIKHAFAKQAAIRKDTFESREEARNYFKQKPFFTNFSEDSFNAYVKHGLIPASENAQHNLQLAFTRKKESLVFSSIPKISNITPPKIPVDVVIGKRSNLLNKFDLNWWEKSVNAKLHFHEGGHMLCFEDPSGFAQLVNAFLDNNSEATNKGK